MNEQNKEPEFFTPEQLAKKLQIAKKTLINWTLKHSVPGQVKVFGRWRYRRTEIEKALLNNRL